MIREEPQCTSPSEACPAAQTAQAGAVPLPNADHPSVDNGVPAEPIRQYGDSVLRTKAKPIRQINATVRALATRMAESMYAAHGVGLAAPQIGESRRLVVLDVGDGLVTLVNPRIIHAEGSEVEEEACLSVVGLCGEVERYSRVLVRAKGLDGKELTIEGEGLLARVLQHEVDHLDGVLFVDRASVVTPVSEPADPANLRVVFLGVPDFAVPTLTAIASSRHSVELVVTSPDRRSGRGLATKPTPVKTAAQALDLPIVTVEPTDSAGLERILAEQHPDVLMVAAWGGLLTEKGLASARLATLNLHASLLPRWRGAAPIQRAIMAGDRVTGVTVMYMAAKLDTGDILLQQELELTKSATGGETAQRLALAGAALSVEALDLLAADEAPRRQQDPDGVSWAPKLLPSDERISWEVPASETVNRIRALAPRPAAYFVFKDGRVKVLEARQHLGHDDGEVAAPGTVLERDQTSVRVATGAGSIWLDRLHAAGTRAVSGAAFLDGRRLAVGDTLSEGGV